MITINQLLANLEHEGFFGSLEIKLEAGKVVLLRKTETIRPTEDRRDNRGHCDVRAH